MEMSLDSERELVLLLRRLAERELDDAQEDAASEDVRAALTRVVGLEHAERIEYTRYEFDHEVYLKTIQGLALEGPGELLSHLLLRSSTIDPRTLASVISSGELRPQQFHAAIYAIYWILNALEWESRDALIDREYPPEVRERMLASRLRSLDSFRRTGEP